MELSFTAEIEDLNTKIWGTGLRVPVSIVERIKDLGWKRLHCTLAGTIEKATNLSTVENAQFIVLNQQILKKARARIGDSMEVVICEEKSKYGTPMPEAMRSALELDPLASEHFHNLTPGKQRNLIYIVQQVKSSELQIKRALIINEHLKEAGGTLDFKTLHAMLKSK